MFWENFVALCTENNISPTAVVTKLDLAKGNVTSWKRGKTPQIVTQQKIADYFGVDISYFTSESNTASKRSSASKTEDRNTVTIIGRDGAFTKKKLSDEQIKALEALISQMRDASDDL